MAKCRDDRKALLSSSEPLWEQIDELGQEVELPLKKKYSLVVSCSVIVV